MAVEWERSKAERLETELRILRAALPALEAREKRERDDNPSYIRPEQCKAKPETVALVNAVTDKIAEGEAELVALVESYVTIWPAEKSKARKRP